MRIFPYACRLIRNLVIMFSQYIYFIFICNHNLHSQTIVILVRLMLNSYSFDVTENNCSKEIDVVCEVKALNILTHCSLFSTTHHWYET